MCLILLRMMGPFNHFTACMPEKYPTQENTARLYMPELSGTFVLNIVQGGPRKVKPTTILLVTFECVGKIQ